MEKKSCEHGTYLQYTCKYCDENLVLHLSDEDDCYDLDVEYGHLDDIESEY
jgi:hypothetical protein